MIASAITPAPGLRLFPVSGQRLGQVHPRQSWARGLSWNCPGRPRPSSLHLHRVPGGARWAVVTEETGRQGLTCYGRNALPALSIGQADLL